METIYYEHSFIDLEYLEMAAERKGAIGEMDVDAWSLP